MTITLTATELRMLVNAINWTTSVPLDLAATPKFTNRELRVLNEVMSFIAERLHDGQTRAFVNAVTITMNADQFSAAGLHRLLRLCAESFFHEIGHSEAELLAVTGLPRSVLISLLEK